MKKILIAIVLQIICSISFAQDKKLTLQSIDASAFPSVKMQLSSKTALNKTDLQIKENGEIAEITAFEEGGNAQSTSTKGAAAHFFLLDASSFITQQQLNATKAAVKKRLLQMQNPLLANVAYYQRSNSVEMIKRVSTEFTSDYTTLASDEMVKITRSADKKPVVDLYKVVAEAIDFMGSRSNLPEHKILFVVSSGNNNGNSVFSLADCIKKAADKHIIINAIGLRSGTQNAIDNLKLLASNTGGSFSYANTTDDIFNFFSLEQTSSDTNTKTDNGVSYTLSWESKEAANTENISVAVIASGIEETMTYASGSSNEVRATETAMSKYKWPLLAGIGGLLLASIIIFTLAQKKKKRKQAEEHQQMIEAQNEERKKREEKAIKAKAETDKNNTESVQAKTIIETNEPVKNPLKTSISSGYNPALVITINGVTQHLPIQKQATTIGRSGNNDFVIADSTVSGQHAIVTIESGEVFITDQQSTNGTFINGNRVSKIKLTKGDTIQFGQINGYYTV